MGTLRIGVISGVMLALLLAGCGGSGGSSPETTLPTIVSPPADTTAAISPAATVPAQTTAAADNVTSATSAIVTVSATESATALSAHTLLLLLPDDADVADPFITTWLDAAAEEGLHLSTVFDSQFMALGSGALQYAGVVLPDVVHQAATDELTQAVRDYVNAGGKLMLTFDAAILDQSWFYPLQDPARLSGLAGVGYVYYNEFYQGLIPTIWGAGPVLGVATTLRTLQVPPGKSMPYPPVAMLADANAANNAQATNFSSDLVPMPAPTLVALAAVQSARYPAKLATQTTTSGSSTNDVAARAPISATAFGNAVTPLAVADQAVSTYGYGYADYPSYITRGEYDGQTLLSSPELGLVAGVRSAGQGRVLFVNLPLAFLKNYGTDGMLLNGFLHYFSVEMLHLPRLSPQPDGRGGLVLNWHVDSAIALDPVARLDQLGVWQRGRFSIDVTAGPDAIVPGDGLGVNVPGDPIAHNWLRRFVSDGHQVGSHGGWVHDYYGSNANEDNAAEFLPYLIMNKDAIEQVTGSSVIEYSAPAGNNPTWALDWLESNGILGYYTTAHTGMAITHSYENGVLRNPGMWALPVTPFGSYATFEEFEYAGISTTEISAWLSGLLDFVTANHTNRLIYFHPQGAIQYPNVLSGFFDRADQLQSGGMFNWYTAVDLARFSSRRQQVTWSVEQSSSTTVEFEANHPTNLAEQSWLLPKIAYAKPTIESGQAHVAEDSLNWIVVAESGTQLGFAATTR